jgi:methyl-accepting chemotaxis protein
MISPLVIRLIITVLVSLFVIIAVVATAHFTIELAEYQARRLLSDRVQNHLIAVRETKKGQIENYFQNLNKQIQLYARTQEIIEAMRGAKKTFPEFIKEVNLLTPSQRETKLDYSIPYREALVEYYDNEFTKEYDKFNVEMVTDLKSILNQLDVNSVALQYHYIVENPNPVGTRAELVAANDASSYTHSHRVYHQQIKALKKYSEAEDILLVDSETGLIVYSVNKAVDFATSLIDGPYAKTSLGKVFQKANDSEADEVSFVDFSAYLPAYDNQRAFLGTPIFEGEKKIGVLIFEITSQGINDIMTYQKAWLFEESGMTGETYLVAAEGTMRSESRLLVENKEEYLSAVWHLGLPPDIISQIELKDTSVGLQIVDTPGKEAVFNGDSGLLIYEDYYGEFVFSAYTPLNLLGLQWAVFSTLQEDEALEEAVEIFSMQTKSGAMQIVIGVLLIGFIALLLSWPSKSKNIIHTEAKTAKKREQNTVQNTYTLEQIIAHLKRLND